MHYLDPIDYQTAEFVEQFDELPLWSAPFGLMLLEQVPLRRGMTILDVGAGTGFLSIELAQRCGPDSTVIAVDPWEKAIRRLEKKATYLGIRNIKTIVQDAARLDLASDSVDLIVSNLGVNNFSNAVEVLKECHRVTKPGGGLCMTTNLVGHMAEFYDVYRETLVELGLSDRLASLDAHINHRATLDSLKTMLTYAGFTDLEITTSEFHERFADGTSMLNHFFMRLGFVGGWKSVVSDVDAERVFINLEARLNRIASGKGLSLTIPTACVWAIKPTNQLNSSIL